MDAYCITLSGLPQSRDVARRCIESGRQHGIGIQPFEAVDKYAAERVMRRLGLSFSWCDAEASDLQAVIGCFLSHFLLWQRCSDGGRETLVLEHDALFQRALPDLSHDGLLNIGQPSWTFGLDDVWYEVQPDGIFGYPFPQFRGAYGYILRPDRARHLIAAATENGICPVDEFINRRTCPFVQGMKPPVVVHCADFSTIQKHGRWIGGGQCHDDVWGEAGARLAIAERRRAE